MAEDFGVTLKIGTDTTDLDKLPDKVADVKQRIEQPIKPPAPINITANTAPAERNVMSFFSRILAGVRNVRRAVSGVFAAFGMVSFVVMGVMSIYNGFKKVMDMATATSRAIAQMRWDNWVSGFNRAADAMIGKHQKILALLKEEQDVTNKATSLQTMESSQTRAQEDQARRQNRQAALAAVTDPRERQRLEDSYAAEDDRIARARYEQDKRTRLRQLDDEESMYRSKENSARAKIPGISAQIANQEEIVYRARLSTSQGGDKEKNDKYIQDAQKRIDALKAEKKALEDLAETMKREADYRKAQANIVEKSSAPVGSQSERAARWQAQDDKDKQTQVEFQQEEAKRAALEADEQRLRNAQFAERAAITDQDKAAARAEQVDILKERETKAMAQAKVAKNTLEYELAKPVQERDEKVIAKARQEITENEVRARGARSERENIEQNAVIERRDRQVNYFAQLANEIEAARPKNRLAAMGLGSGVSVDPIARQNAANVEAILYQCQHILAAIKENKPMPQLSVYS